jgi:hypothetical protein
LSLLRYQERDALLEIFQRFRHKVRHVQAAAPAHVHLPWQSQQQQTSAPNTGHGNRVLLAEVQLATGLLECVRSHCSMGQLCAQRSVCRSKPPCALQAALLVCTLCYMVVVPCVAVCAQANFDIAKAWDGRCRKWYADRYDFRTNMVRCTATPPVCSCPYV